MHTTQCHVPKLCCISCFAIVVILLDVVAAVVVVNGFVVVFGFTSASGCSLAANDVWCKIFIACIPLLRLC